jgi:hypothetical protein
MANVLDRRMFTSLAGDPGSNQLTITPSNWDDIAVPNPNAGIATVDTGRPTPTKVDTQRSVVDEKPDVSQVQTEVQSNQGIDTSRQKVSQRSGIESMLPTGEPIDYAKELGGLVKDKPYSNWDYIRDMSAGLLASKNPSFLGGLGEASLDSNANRSKAVSDNNALDAKIKIASLDSKDAWTKIKYKQAVDLELTKAAAVAKGAPEFKKGTVIKTEVRTTNGVEDTWITRTFINPSDRNSIPIGQQRQLENGTWVWDEIKSNNSKVEARRHTKGEDLQSNINTYMGKPESLDAHVNSVGRLYDYKDMPILGLKDSDAYNTWIGKIMEWDSDIANQIQSSIDDGDGQATQSFINSKLQLSGLASSGRRLLESGPLSELSGDERKAMTPVISKLSKQMARQAWSQDPGGDYSAAQFVDKALRYMIPRIKWDLSGDEKFEMGLSEKQIVDETETFDDYTGQGAFNMQRGTDNYYFADNYWQPTFQIAGESQVFNKTQWDLLGRKGQSEVKLDSGRIKDRLTRNFHIPAAQAEEDVMHSFIESRSIWGGKDEWGSENSAPSYQPPDNWKVEPQYFDNIGDPYDVEDLRANKILWNGFGKGQWIFYEPDAKGVPRRKIITPRDANGSVVVPKSIPIR